MSGTPAAATPFAGSVRLGFRMIYAAVLLLAVGWATSNLRQIAPDNRAVVLRFGRVDRVRNAGLLLAWPRPIEEVRLLPARDRQIALPIAFQRNSFQSDETDVQFAPNDDVIHLQGDRDINNAAYLLTGDGAVVQLDATVFFEITDPTAYLLAGDRVQPALQRLFRESVVAFAASHGLDDFLVARPERSTGEAAAALAARRRAVRGDLQNSINAHLQALRARRQGLGVAISRIDLVALLPPAAKPAFDAVLTAVQTADQGAAAARSDAARMVQEAERERDRVLAEATAAASERVRAAKADTARVAALESQETPATRDALMAEAYREQIGAIMKKAGEVTAVDTRGGQQLLLPGPTP